jgi:hypothetical protein
MRALKRIFTRLRNFATGRRGDERLREEMEQHLAIQTEENIRAGLLLYGAAHRRNRSERSNLVQFSQRFQPGHHRSCRLDSLTR